MTALVMLTWLLAMGVLVAVIITRLTDADQRWRPAVQAASFNELLIPVAAAPWAVVTLLHLAGVVPLHAPAPVLLLPPAAFVGAVLLAGPSFVRTSGASASGPEVALVTANIESGSPDPEAAARAVLGLDADVVLIQEYTPATQAGCHAAGLVDAYAHGWEAPLDGWFGSALFSRHPIESAEVREIGDRPMGVARVRIGRQIVTFVNVHVQAPIHQHDIAAWHDAFIDLAELADDARGLVVLAGDWNATATHQPMRDLLAKGVVVDAHRVAHRPLPRTWPVGRAYPPLLCLDHVLVSPSIEVLGTREVAVAATDHRALCVGLRLPGRM